MRYARSHHSEDTISYDVMDISKAEPGPRTRFPRGFHKGPSTIMIITVLNMINANHFITSATCKNYYIHIHVF